MKMVVDIRSKTKPYQIFAYYIFHLFIKFKLSDSKITGLETRLRHLKNANSCKQKNDGENL